jgi:conjugative transfer signal peptidase TraF
MDTGIYRKTDALPERGSVVSFEIPEAARLYARQRGIEIRWDSFLKPIAAVAGDDVCVSLAEGLVINGERLAGVHRTDSAGHVVPVWSHCRQLMAGEFFVYAPRVANSYDSRYYGPVRAEMIKGVYKPLWTW